MTKKKKKAQQVAANAAPSWTKGLWKPPSKEHVTGQVRLWGILTLIGAGFPPAQDYLGRFTWLVCVAQLTFRGMPEMSVKAEGSVLVLIKVAANIVRLPLLLVLVPGLLAQSSRTVLYQNMLVVNDGPVHLVSLSKISYLV